MFGAYVMSNRYGFILTMCLHLSLWSMDLPVDFLYIIRNMPFVCEQEEKPVEIPKKLTVAQQGLKKFVNEFSSIGTINYAKRDIYKSFPEKVVGCLIDYLCMESCTFRSLGIDPNVTDCNGYSFMHYAVLCDDVLLLAVLKTCGVDVNKKNKRGNTPLHLATWAAHGDVIAVLLEYHASWNTLNLSGVSAQYLAQSH